MAQPAFHTDHSSEHFLALLAQYAEFVRQAGKQVSCTSETAPGRLFAKLEDARKSAVIARLHSELDFFREILNEGYRLDDSPRFMWRYVVKAGLVPRSDVFQKIDETDVVVFYDHQFIHSFQNLNFFDYVSTTLEQLFCTPVYEYSRRNPSIEQKMYALGGKMVAGEIRDTIDPELPEHLIEEVGTASLLRFNMKFKWMSPVQAGPKFGGIIAIMSCTAVQK